MNEGVQIIVNRMKEHPEEFFGEGGKWNWMFRETLREVLNESEKAALYEGLKEVRRTEFTAMAASTVIKMNEAPEEDEHTTSFGGVIPKKEGAKVRY